VRQAFPGDLTAYEVVRNYELNTHGKSVKNTYVKFKKQLTKGVEKLDWRISPLENKGKVSNFIFKTKMKSRWQVNTRKQAPGRRHT